VADSHYLTKEHRAWRTAVLERANWRCEAVVNGQRCTSAHPDKLFADHVIEIADNGSRLDPSNGMCLCASCHQIKTNEQRVRRHRD
jgi:hypothetical protein